MSQQPSQQPEKRQPQPKRQLPPPGPQLTFEQALAYAHEHYGRALAKLAQRGD